MKNQEPQTLQVVFIHGPAASGKYTIASHLSAITGLPLFHNHLAADIALALFPFGSEGFNTLRATVWRTAFAEAARARQSFIFTFHPEASVDPGLITELVRTIHDSGGRVHFIEIECATEEVLKRIANPSRSKFKKLTDPNFYLELERQGAFRFPKLPEPLLRLDTGIDSAETAAEAIAAAMASTPFRP